jgi:hypothetical protein
MTSSFKKTRYFLPGEFVLQPNEFWIFLNSNKAIHQKKKSSFIQHASLFFNQTNFDFSEL